ncbi:gluconokinase [Caenimonas sedimenti]|uniref:Gluconokinase n=1 Tax=Caenimonas sedimenti TaxID=2596921 RepID=A0A562ZQ80_9BURK|nr:gluconokinase [Caenimonas sedimenti]TWO70488.1 gluconokinase [Caenimonas sedimenti]
MNRVHVVIMGVAGCGKSAVGALLAARLGVPLIEGDDFHPAANIEKMRQALPLDDNDRAGWLARLAEELCAHPGGAVLTCSALKVAYRVRLREAVPDLKFVHLALSQHQAMERVASRTDHFYPPSLVASQFEALQDPAGEPGVLVVDATAHVARLVDQAVDWLGRAAER